MINKIKELKEQGKTVREIAENLNINKDKVFRILKSLSQNNNETSEEVRQEVRQDTDTLIQSDDDLNSIGVKKLRKSDYTKEALEAFPDVPYWD